MREEYEEGKEGIGGIHRQGGKGSLSHFRAIRRLECVCGALRFDVKADEGSRSVDALFKGEWRIHLLKENEAQ